MITINYPLFIVNEIPMSNTLCSRDQSAILQKLSVFVIHYGKYQTTHKKP